jgi:hypothetical protein
VIGKAMQPRELAGRDMQEAKWAVSALSADSSRTRPQTQSAVRRPARWRRKSLRIFSRAFRDPSYLAWERDSKW